MAPAKPVPITTVPTGTELGHPDTVNGIRALHRLIFPAVIQEIYRASDMIPSVVSGTPLSQVQVNLTFTSMGDTEYFADGERQPLLMFSDPTGNRIHVHTTRCGNATLCQLMLDLAYESALTLLVRCYPPLADNMTRMVRQGHGMAHWVKHHTRSAIFPMAVFAEYFSRKATRTAYSTFDPTFYPVGPFKGGSTAFDEEEDDLTWRLIAPCLTGPSEAVLHEDLAELATNNWPTGWEVAGDGTVSCFGMKVLQLNKLKGELDYQNSVQHLQLFAGELISQHRRIL